MTDTERLDFIERNNLKVHTRTVDDPTFSVFLFKDSGVRVFSGASAREAIDSAIRSVQLSEQR